MRPQHTPGPWILNKDQDEDFTMRTILSSEKKVNHHKEIAIVTTGSYPDEIEDANARLIAVAPELLDALQKMIAWANIQDGSPSQQLRDEALSVISKAKGI